MQDLCQSERRNFVTLIEVNMHLIVCISGLLPFVMQIKTSIFLTFVFKTIDTHRESEGENIVKSRTEFLKSGSHNLHALPSSLIATERNFFLSLSSSNCKNITFKSES